MILYPEFVANKLVHTAHHLLVSQYVAPLSIWILQSFWINLQRVQHPIGVKQVKNVLKSLLKNTKSF